MSCPPCEPLSLYLRLLESLPVGVFVIDAGGVPVYANQMAIEMLGKGVVPEAAGRLGEVYRAFTSDGQPYPRQRMPIVRALAGEACTVDDMYLHRDDRRLRVEVTGSPVYGPQGEVLYASAVFKDISRLDLAERQAAHDLLTGLPNRAGLLERLPRVLRRRGAGLLFLDLDGFKVVNDLYGHAVGDELLRRIARQIRSSIRKRERVYRYGGDEFVVICEGLVTQAELDAVAQRITSVVEGPAEVCGHQVEVGVSIGRVLCPVQASDGLAEIARADADMYRRKLVRRADTLPGSR